MFVVTKDGVIATDPVAYGRPTGGQDYINEIRKITQAPIRYLVYSHHHFDHIAGGKAFKDAGATIIAHKNAKKRLAAVNDPNTPMPDRVCRRQHHAPARRHGAGAALSRPNHSDTTLVMRLPREKIIFVVDTIPVGSMPGRGMIDFYPLETRSFMKRVLAMDWERLIPGHPGQPNGRLGTKKDARTSQIVSGRLRRRQAAGQAGRCWEPGEKEFKLEGFESWPGYAAGLPFIARRYCGLWGRGT